MGGAQPLAATMAGASMLAVECQPSRIEKRLRDRLSRRAGRTLDEALAMIEAAPRAQAGLGRLLGNAAEICPSWCAAACARRVTDQTSAHDPVNGYLPRAGRSPQWDERARAIPKAVDARPSARWPSTCAPCSISRAWACRPSTTATTSARWRSTRRRRDAFDFPGFVPAYIRPLFCRGIGPFRWVALSGDPEDIYKHRRQGQGADARTTAPAQLARHGARAHPVPGPAGAHLLGRPRRARIASAWRSTRWWRAAN
jgi:urocanate hydratase